MANDSGSYGEGAPPADLTAITPSQLERRLKRYFMEVKTRLDAAIKRGDKKLPKADLAIFIFGPPGVGKSSVVKAAAESPEVDFKTKVYLASMMDPVTLRGLPNVVTNESTGRRYTDWIPNIDWMTHGPTVYFFDELNLAPPGVTAALYRIILDGEVGDQDISMYPRIAAGNRSADAADLIQNLPLPLYTRFEIYYMKADLDDFLKYAESHNIEQAVIEFLKVPANKKYIYYVDADLPEKAAATPRSWERVSTLIKNGFVTPIDFEGAVGQEPGAAFYSFYYNYLQNKGETLKNEDLDVGTLGPKNSLDIVKKKRKVKK